MKTVIEILDEMERRPAHPITEREAYALFNERSACIAALRYVLHSTTGVSVEIAKILRGEQ